MANQNTYNSRVTTEVLERRFREVFPSQAGAELVDDLFASGVIVPTVDFTNAASGSDLSEELQQAWDFSTGVISLQNATNTTIINGTGFWKIGVTFNTVNSNVNANLNILDAAGASKQVWNSNFTVASTGIIVQPTFYIFLRSGDRLRGTCGAASGLNVWFRQVASLDGTLVNPLGFVAS